MKDSFRLFTLLLLFLTSCVQSGYRSTYIISEQSKPEASSYVEEEAR